MSNPNNIVISNSGTNLKELKDKYIELITEGFIETRALSELNFPKATYLRLMLEDIDFRDRVNEARKLRADYWVSVIANDVHQDYTKDEIPSKRLQFDKLQFLAKADNPEKYGNNPKKLDINIDLTQFKLLPPEEAIKSLANDPFAPKVIEAECIEIEEELL